ncbi:hypothetical protein K1F50_05000 [Muricauda oceani]|uniref:Uncharacterized protein n=1 Tax=Flagellimonas oceani TaxID=2698672 RepID=A0A6G7J4V8_9FLAO|nr:hypothetical protein [Allomuricauda oceani]MBW8242146.1 hypothetical protein [Allomuricauda oceani]QII45911.1 hypothetical protein GVT53_14925 [Allomuricauda oceani]
MKKKYALKEYLPVILLFLFLIGFIIYTIIKKGKYEEIYLSEEFDERVIDVFEEKGNTYLFLTNRNDRIKIENSRNYDYEPAFLYDFIKENDRVLKNKCSDTLYIERSSKNYHFLIGSTVYNREGKSKEFIQNSLSERAIMNERNDCN